MFIQLNSRVRLPVQPLCAVGLEPSEPITRFTRLHRSFSSPPISSRITRGYQYSSGLRRRHGRPTFHIGTPRRTTRPGTRTPVDDLQPWGLDERPNSSAHVARHDVTPIRLAIYAVEFHGIATSRRSASTRPRRTTRPGTRMLVGTLGRLHRRATMRRSSTNAPQRAGASERKVAMGAPVRRGVIRSRPASRNGSNGRISTGWRPRDRPEMRRHTHPANIRQWSPAAFYTATPAANDAAGTRMLVDELPADVREPLSGSFNSNAESSAAPLAYHVRRPRSGCPSGRWLRHRFAAAPGRRRTRPWSGGCPA